MSSRKGRKSLDDILAQKFIYGEKAPSKEYNLSSKQNSSLASSKQPSESDFSANEPLGATEKLSKKLPLMDKFQTPPKEATIRFTVDLPASMHRKLSLLAAKTGKKKAEIVRVLLDEALGEVSD